MALEVARRLIDNVWQTVVGDDAGASPGGSSAPVGVVLQMSAGALDGVNLGAGGGGAKFMKWDSMFDNTFDFNVLTEIPDGLGLDFAFDGSDSVFTVTENGTWIFEFLIALPTDADIEGHFGFRNVDISDGYFGPGTDSDHPAQSSFTYTAPLQLNVGAEIEFLIAANNAPDPYRPDTVQAAIVRVR